MNPNDILERNFNSLNIQGGMSTRAGAAVQQNNILENSFSRGMLFRIAEGSLKAINTNRKSFKGSR
jgi:hypothetical protein